MHRTESRFAIGPSNRLIAAVYVCTFQPGNFVGCDNEGVNFVCVPRVSLLSNSVHL